MKLTSTRDHVNAGSATLLAFAIVPPILLVLHQSFYIGLATRVLVFAIAASGLNLILGYGGMVSLGHAAFVGIGAYGVGISAFYGVGEGVFQILAAVGASATAALLVGAVAVRTKGIHFIMISLAFGQMFYYLAVSLSLFGGDDGLSIASNGALGPFDLSDAMTLYYATFLVLIIVLAFIGRLVVSRFGMALRAVKSNEQRAAAIGFSPYHIRLVAFLISGTVCGLAGALLANQNLFVSPASMTWERSGEVLIIVILGGLGTVTGPLLGATAYVLLEYFLSQRTEHWQIALGAVLLTVVRFGSGGLTNLLAVRRRLSTVQQ